MTIEYLPPGLKSAIEHPYASKMLKGRDGHAVVCDSTGSKIIGLAEGSIIKVYAAAVEYSKQNPKHRIQVIENTCGVGSPDFDYSLRF